MNIAGSKKMNGEPGSFGDRISPQGDPSSGERSLEEMVKPLENELAKTKIALAESECRNDDMNHRLSVALAELESYRNSSSSGSTWLWKNLSFHKDHKRGSTQEDLLQANVSATSALQSAPKK
jgi:septal ring factor EnvC (AmiA/AmiB activator)